MTSPAYFAQMMDAAPVTTPDSDLTNDVGGLAAALGIATIHEIIISKNENIKFSLAYKKYSPTHTKQTPKTFIENQLNKNLKINT